MSDEPKRSIGWKVGIVSHHDLPALDAPISYCLSETYETLEEAKERARCWNLAESEDNFGGAFSDLAVVVRADSPEGSK